MRNGELFVGLHGTAGVCGRLCHPGTAFQGCSVAVQRGIAQLPCRIFLVDLLEFPGQFRPLRGVPAALFHLFQFLPGGKVAFGIVRGNRRARGKRREQHQDGQEYRKAFMHRDGPEIFAIVPPPLLPCQPKMQKITRQIPPCAALKLDALTLLC